MKSANNDNDLDLVTLVTRFTRIESARRWAADSKFVGGRTKMHRIFYGPCDPDTDTAEYWMTSSSAVSAALRAGGYELCELR